MQEDIALVGDMHIVQSSNSNFIQHAPCDSCGSSDGVGVYDDGHAYCYVCSTPQKGSTTPLRREKRLSNPNVTPATGVFRGIPRRGLPEEAIKKYGIDVCLDKTLDVAHRYPYYKENLHVANKVILLTPHEDTNFIDSFLGLIRRQVLKIVL